MGQISPWISMDFRESWDGSRYVVCRQGESVLPRRPTCIALCKAASSSRSETQPAGELDAGMMTAAGSVPRNAMKLLPPQWQHKDSAHLRAHVAHSEIMFSTQRLALDSIVLVCKISHFCPHLPSLLRFLAADLRAKSGPVANCDSLNEAMLILPIPVLGSPQGSSVGWD